MKDRVTSELHAAVLVRDRACFLSKMDAGHSCRDRWGNPHAPTDLAMLTLDHVKDAARMGKRAPSDLAHLVAMCWAGNVGVPSKAVREAERAYLARVAA